MSSQSTVGLLPPPPRWVTELTAPVPTKTKNANSIPDPPGYSAARSGGKKSQVSNRKTPTPQETETLKLKKSWEIALAPAKQIPMQAIMMYMSGNSLQIFSIMMVWMLFKNPITAIMATNQTFSKFESDGARSQMFGVKLVYIFTNIMLLGLGVYKVNSMGLLPSTRSDWLAWETERIPLERAYFAT